MLQLVLDSCQKLDGADIHLVLGANHEDIQSKIQIQTSKIIFNDNWSEGIGSSIRSATRKLQDTYDGILFIAGDQPLVRTGHLLQLIEKWKSSRGSICAAQYQGSLGIPAIFPRQYFVELLQLEGDEGAKKLLLRNSDKTQLVELPEAAVDIDTPSDLARLAQ